MARGEVLKYAIAFALLRARKVVRGLKDELTDAERFEIADHVVGQLKDHGDPWGLSKDAKNDRRRPLSCDDA
jgi:hypothetical protein